MEVHHLQKEKISYGRDTLQFLDPWDIKYNEMVDYYNEFGTSKINYQDKKHHSLYLWCVNQKHFHAIGELSPAYISRLKSIDFDLETLDERWFKIAIRVTSRSFENMPLTHKETGWLYRNNKQLLETPEKLSDVQIKVLGRINKQREIKGFEPCKEMNNFAKILEYVVINEASEVPENLIVNGENLGEWYYGIVHSFYHDKATSTRLNRIKKRLTKNYTNCKEG